MAQSLAAAVQQLAGQLLPPAKWALACCHCCVGQPVMRSTKYKSDCGLEHANMVLPYCCQAINLGCLHTVCFAVNRELALIKQLFAFCYAIGTFKQRIYCARDR